MGAKGLNEEMVFRLSGIEKCQTGRKFHSSASSASPNFPTALRISELSSRWQLKVSSIVAREGTESTCTPCRVPMLPRHLEQVT
jgi:hypothetical protein